MESKEEYRIGLLLERLVVVCREWLPPEALEGDAGRDLAEAEEELAWRRFKEYQRKTGPQLW